MEQTFTDLAHTHIAGEAYVKVSDLRTLLAGAQQRFAVAGLTGEVDSAKAVGMCIVTDALIYIVDQIPA